MSCSNLFNRAMQTLHNPHLFIVCTLWKALAYNIMWRNSTGITWHTPLNVISFKGRSLLLLSLAGSRTTWKKRKIHGVLNTHLDWSHLPYLVMQTSSGYNFHWKQKHACLPYKAFFFLPCFFVSYYHLLSQMIRWRICVNRISEPFHLPQYYV